MDILLSVAAFLFLIVGILGCIVPVLPGPALSFVGLLCAYGCSYTSIPTSTLWLWLAATLVVMVADYFLPAYMTRLLGGSRSGQIGATVGLIGSVFFFPTIIGILLAPFFGAVLGELLHDKHDTSRAIRVGFGSFVSFAVGTGVKLLVAIGLFVHVVTDTYPVMKNWVLSIF